MDSSLSVCGLQVAGAVSVVIGIGHMGFHRIFGWEREFSKVTALNAKVFNTLHIATTLLLVLLGILTLRYATLLAGATEAAWVACLCLFLFWFWRLVWQVFYFRPSRIEHDDRLLALHYGLIVMFGALVIGYGIPLVAGGGIAGLE